MVYLDITLLIDHLKTQKLSLKMLNALNGVKGVKRVKDLMVCYILGEGRGASFVDKHGEICCAAATTFGVSQLVLASALWERGEKKLRN